MDLRVLSPLAPGGFGAAAELVPGVRRVAGGARADLSAGHHQGRVACLTAAAATMPQDALGAGAGGYRRARRQDTGGRLLAQHDQCRPGDRGEFFRWCSERQIDAEGEAGFNPAAEVPRLKCKRYARGQLLSQGEVRALLGVLRHLTIVSPGKSIKAERICLRGFSCIRNCFFRPPSLHEFP
jgi:hypothetical protein